MKHQRRISLLLIVVFIAVCITPASAYTVYNNTTDISIISAKYEAGGLQNPGAISGGVGDPGGASYGAYQFASNSNVPHTFAQWCISSGQGTSVGQQLMNAYQADGNTYGAGFNAAWRAIAQTDANGFLMLQFNYTKERYYDVVAANLLSEIGLNVNARGIALKNAVWSRSVQHGTGGCMRLFRAIAEAQPGLASLSDPDIIRLLYVESSAVVSDPPYTNSNQIFYYSTGNADNDYAKNVIIRDYGLAGNYLKYYSRCSSAIQFSVFRRIRINELNDLLAMYQEEYPYRDVNTGAWYFPYVNYAINHSLMNGTSAATFEPATPTNRAMFITILWRLCGSPGDYAATGFIDVPQGTYYTKAVNWAAGTGVVTGTGADTFSPDRLLTRQEMITMFFRYAKAAGLSISDYAPIDTFTDCAFVSDWAVAAMHWSIGSGMIGGTNNGTLNPAGQASRAETATMLKRFIEKNALISGG